MPRRIAIRDREGVIMLAIGCERSPFVKAAPPNGTEAMPVSNPTAIPAVVIRRYMMHQVTIQEAYAHFPTVMKDVLRGEEVILTDKNLPIAKVIPLNAQE